MVHGIYEAIDKAQSVNEMRASIASWWKKKDEEYKAHHKQGRKGISLTRAIIEQFS